MIDRHSQSKGISLDALRQASDVVRACDEQIALFSDDELAAGRLLEGFLLRRDLDAVAETLQANPTVFFVGRRKSPKPYTPRSVRETLELGAMARSERSDRLLPRYVMHTFTRDRHTTLFGRAPYVASQQVGETMISLRRENPLPLDTVWSIALAGIGMLALMILPISRFPDRAIAVPLPHGLLLGRLTTDYDGTPAKDVQLNRATEMTGGGTVEHPYVPSPMAVDPQTGDIWVFQAETYLLKKDFDAGQRALFETLVAFQDRLAECVKLLGLSCIFPQHGDCVRLMRPETGMMLRIERARAEMVELLLSPGIAQAMGNEVLPELAPVLEAVQIKSDSTTDQVAELIRNAGGTAQGLR